MKRDKGCQSICEN